MIDTILDSIATQVKQTCSWVKVTKHIARQDPASGIVLLERPEEWVGIDDQHDGRMYFRFRDGWDMTFSDARLISGKANKSTARMRGVLLHYCTNQHEIARFTSFAILNSQGYGDPRYSVILRSMSTDKQFITKQETKKDDFNVKDDRLRLVMVDFDVFYKDAILLGDPVCLPTCDGC